MSLWEFIAISDEMGAISSHTKKIEINEPSHEPYLVRLEKLETCGKTPV